MRRLRRKYMTPASKTSGEGGGQGSTAVRVDRVVVMVTSAREAARAVAARAAARAAVEKEASRAAVVMVTVARVEAGWVAARAVAAASVGESSGGGEGKAMAARAVARAAPACDVTDVPGARRGQMWSLHDGPHLGELQKTAASGTNYY